MTQHRIVMILDGEEAPVGSAKVHWATDHSTWPGFPVVLARYPSCGQAGSCYWPASHVILTIAGQLNIEFDAGGRHEHFVMVPGTITIWPKGYLATSLKWSGIADILAVGLENPDFDWLVWCNKDQTQPPLKHQAAIRDPQLAGILSCIREEIRLGCPGGRLYSESLSLALYSYITHRYAYKQTKSRKKKTSLNRLYVERILGYIHANLSNDLSIGTIANEVGVSPHHLCHLFKNSFGTTIHRYIVQMRINKSKELLKTNSMSIVDVAMLLGFANQSHFTEVFRRFTGTTPKRFQSEFANGLVPAATREHPPAAQQSVLLERRDIGNRNPGQRHGSRQDRNRHKHR